MLFEQAEIMYPSLAECCADDLSISLIDYYLRFERMSLFLATIVSSLFFLGRSIGLSMTSIASTLQV
jgi:hypothetical protein